MILQIEFSLVLNKSRALSTSSAHKDKQIFEITTTTMILQLRNNLSFYKNANFFNYSNIEDKAGFSFILYSIITLRERERANEREKMDKINNSIIVVLFQLMQFLQLCLFFFFCVRLLLRFRIVLFLNTVFCNSIN